MSLDKNLEAWLTGTAYGQYILSYEKTFYNNITQNIFGYHAIQLSLTNINLLSNNKIVNHYFIDQNLKCDIRLLPFENNSIDLIICPHSLELSPSYGQVLAECFRILMPKGKLILTGFNRYSLFSLMAKKQVPPLNYINLKDIQKQLHSLNFQISGGKFLSYCPPLNSADHFKKFAILDKIGDRWLPTLANVYALVASKDVVSATWIKPKSQIKFAPQVEIAK